MEQDYISFTPLIDAKTGIYCHILKINETKVLVNCGTNSFLDTSIYNSILNKILECDAILITSYDINCLGALPYILSNNYYNSVYLTLPVKTLGLIVLDEYNNIINEYYKESNPRSNIKKMYQYKPGTINFDFVDKLTEIKYLQPFSIKDIQVCAYNCGNSIGSTLFKIRRGIENVYIGYNLNHRKENHLDGVDLKKIKDPYLLITNSTYVYSENVSLTKRDSNIRTIIEEYLTNKIKIIIPVRYSRFLEISLVISSISKESKVICLSPNIRSFVDRAKSMIEWTGSKALENFHSEKKNPFDLNSIEFISHYSKLKDFDICIILDENFISGSSSSLLYKYNNENTVILFTEDDKEDNLIKNSNKLKAFNYCGKYIEELYEDVKKENLFCNESSGSTEEEEFNWTNNSHEIWIHVFRSNENSNDENKQISDDMEQVKNDLYGNIYKTNEIIVNETIVVHKNQDGAFPISKKMRNYDNYGEYLDKDKFKKKKILEVVKEDVKIPEKFYVETKKLIKDGFKINCITRTVDMPCVSDYRSFKTIIQSTEPRKIVIVEDDEESSKMLYHSLRYKSYIQDVFICNKSINLSSDILIKIVKLNEDFLKLNYKSIGGYRIAQFKGFKEGNTVKYLGTPKEVMVANLEVRDLKKRFIENNLKVEVQNNIIIVENIIYIILEGNEIIMEGRHDDIYYFVRNILYQSVAII